MKKYQFILDKRLLKRAEGIIREKEDIVFLLLLTIKMILFQPLVESDNLLQTPHVTIYIDKMSRIIFVIKDKIFSFQFPFLVRKEKDGKLLKIFYQQIELDSQITSFLLAIANKTSIFKGELIDLEYYVLEQIQENDWTNLEERYLCELISHLVLFEPGYLRYDYDYGHSNGAIHPLHHLDVYFSSNNTMKIGLKKKMDEKIFLEMIDITSDCKYIE